MQFKIGDKIRFMKKVKMDERHYIPANTIWRVSQITKQGDYVLECPSGEVALVGCRFVDECCEIKPAKDKHNILHDLIQSDGSIDGEKLMEKLSKQNSVEHQNHYNQDIECIKYINSHNLNFNASNIIKYGTRYLLKGKPIEDLQKVIQYAQFEIERLKAEGNK